MIKIFLLRLIPLLFGGLLGTLITPLQSQARSFVLICHESTSEEECNDFLLKTPDAISYKQFVESSTGSIARDVTQRIFSLSQYGLHDVALPNDRERSTFNIQDKGEDNENEISTLIQEISDGFLSHIKKSLLIKLLLLKPESKNFLNSTMNSLATTEGAIAPTKPLNTSIELTSRDFNQQLQIPGSKLPLQSAKEAENSSLQIKLLIEGVIKNPGTDPLALSLYRNDDQLYINGRLIKKELINTIKIYPHLYYHVAYVSNTYKPFFQWSRGNQILPIPKQKLVVGECHNVLWEKSTLDTTTAESFHALFPSGCTSIVSSLHNQTPMLLDKKFPNEISNGISFNERPRSFWSDHPIITIGTSILIFNLFQKELQKNSKATFTWEMKL